MIKKNLLLFSLYFVYGGILAQTHSLSCCDSLCAYFKEIVFYSEYDGKQNLCRWEDDIRISYMGDVTERDSIALQRLVHELDSLIPTISIRFDTIAPNFIYYFVKRSKFKRYVPGYIKKNDGFAEAIHFDNVIKSASVLVNIKLTQEVRNHLIMEETIQCMGLLNDSWTYRESLFHFENITAQELPEIDIALLHLLYNPVFPTGMKEEEFEAIYCDKLKD